MRNFSLPAVIVSLPLLFVTGLVWAAATTATPPPATEKKAGKVEKIDWATMSPDQRIAYMKKVVTPKMKPVFQKFDAKKFKRVDCATCHGKDGKAREYKMPSNDIAALPGTPDAFQAKLKAEPTWPKWTQFMHEQVTPQVAALLGKPHFDPKNPVEDAFSCTGCHKLEKP